MAWAGVPEAAVHEDGQSLRGEGEVGKEIRDLGMRHPSLDPGFRQQEG